jgi:GT2 family glycosyltransferase
MNKNEDNAKYYSYLSEIWKDRVNLYTQTVAHETYGAKIEILRYEVADGKSERERLIAEVADGKSERERLIAEVADGKSERERLIAEVADGKSELERLEAERHASIVIKAKDLVEKQERIQMLEVELTTNLRKPWLPVKEYFQRRLAFLAAGVVEPFSSFRARRFRNSANKRNPRRFLSIAEGTAVAHTSQTGDVYTQQTDTIIDRYLKGNYITPALPLHMQLGSPSIARNRLAAAKFPSDPQVNTVIRFSIVTPFFSHIDHFSHCARSVAGICANEKYSFEWIVVNDDPSISNSKLIDALPENIRSITRLVGDGNNNGIASALDTGVKSANGDWIVLLDCDDMIEFNALEELMLEIGNQPRCRYFTSLMTDIDDNGIELRRRQPDHDTLDLFEVGMVAGHMVAFRCDLYADMGGFDQRFSGVQDYDFALRVSANEKICRIEKHLYRYRWHSKSQSVGSVARQHRMTDAVRIAFLRETIKIRTNRISRPPLSENPEIMCVIRTQGNRMELLINAIASIRDQILPITPCIVVHGDAEAVEFVRCNLPHTLGEGHPDHPAIILQAPRTDLKRGYPCNVALEYLKEHSDRFELLCFLDDDDHFLPTFSERLSTVLRMTGADMAYGMANALPSHGEPYVQHMLRPWLSILGGNFIVFNSFLVRVDAVIDSGAKFDTDMHYLEDYHFLVQMLASGVRAQPLTEVVSEYRILGDGNSDNKQDIKHYEKCSKTVEKLSRVAAASWEIDEFWDDVLSFPTQDGYPFGESELLTMLKALSMFKKKVN